MGISNVPKVYYASHPKNTFYTGIMQFFIFYSVTPFPSSQYNLLPPPPHAMCNSVYASLTLY